VTKEEVNDKMYKYKFYVYGVKGVDCD